MVRSGLHRRVALAFATAGLTMAALLTLPAIAYARAAVTIRPQFGDYASGAVVSPLNPDFVEYLNRHGSGLFDVLGTSAQQRRSGLIPEPLQLNIAPVVHSVMAPLATLPSSYSLPSNKLSPIKDQGGYGTCWAFAVMGSLESGIRPGSTASYSEDNLVLTRGFLAAGTSADTLYNSGGDYSQATAYFARWAGPVYSSDETYGGGIVPPGLAARGHVQDVIFLPNRSGAADNGAIKDALTTYGAVAVYTYMGLDTNLDSSTCYNYSTGAWYYPGGSLGAYQNHAVDIVGWDDNYPAANFNIGNRPPGNGAWLVRNSWGTWWGVQGYYHVSYYDALFAKSGSRVFVGVEPTTNYDMVLQYDPLGENIAYGFTGTDTAWFMNKFTVGSRSILRAASFYANQSNSVYEVYAGVDGAPLSLVASGTMTYAGYHTVRLTAPLSLPVGRFAVAVKLRTPGTSMAVPLQTRIVGYTDQSTGTAGNGFVSADGTHWTDIITKYGANTDVCLKAFLDHAYAISYGAGVGGSIEGSASQVIASGASGTAVIAQPLDGYHFVRWSDNGSTNPRRTDLGTTDLNTTAIFASDGITFQLSYSAGPGGSILGSAAQTISWNSSGAPVTAVPGAGYHFVGWSDGVTTAQRTDNAVTDTIVVTAIFAVDAPTTHTLVYSAGAGGTIQGMNPQTVVLGGNGTLVTAVPTTGYHFVSWSDGITIATRTERNVVADKSVTASFVLNTYAITASAGSGGTISPKGVSQVSHGSASAIYIIAPVSGYVIGDIKVDGVSRGAVSKFTFTNVTAAHAISATFRRKATLSITSDRTTSTRGHTVHLHGTISPNVVNNTHVTVWMRKSTTSKWTLLSTRHTFSSHHWSYSLSTRTRSHGTYYVQVRYAGSSTLAAAISGNRKIVIK